MSDNRGSMLKIDRSLQQYHLFVAKGRLVTI